MVALHLMRQVSRFHFGDLVCRPTNLTSDTAPTTSGSVCNMFQCLQVIHVRQQYCHISRPGFVARSANMIKVRPSVPELLEETKDECQFRSRYVAVQTKTRIPEAFGGHFLRPSRPPVFSVREFSAYEKTALKSRRVGAFAVGHCSRTLQRATTHKEVVTSQKGREVEMCSKQH
jgi:hypothetical protein